MRPPATSTARSRAMPPHAPRKAAALRAPASLTGLTLRGFVERAALVALATLALVGSTACERAAEPDPGAREVFVRYCASCHGEDGRGKGPLAASLKQPPTDLTRLALDNGGNFDESAIMAVIDGRRAVAAHGLRDMPVWGAVFQEEGAEERYPAYRSLLKSRLLVDYLRSIQDEAPRTR